MARRKRTTAAAPPAPPTSGRPAPRHRFFLNPYPNERFGTCPRCGMSAGHRQIALVAVVEPNHLVTLNATCRTCSRCDLIIAHQAEVEALLAQVFREHDPSAIGNAYAMAGTMQQADWEQVAGESLTLQQTAERVRPFAEVVRYDRVSAGNAEAGEPPKEEPPGEEPVNRRHADGSGQALRSERETVPARLRPVFDAIVERTDAVCREHLTDEFAALCRQLAAALARKRPSPLTRGRPEGWACGIAYAIGAVNFLFDPSQKPHFKATELCALFGVSPGTGSARASEIRKLFGMYQFDPRWCLPSKLEDNPLAWMIQVNGLPIDARHAPREVQEEAVRRGLIPYLPKTSEVW